MENVWLNMWKADVMLWLENWNLATRPVLPSARHLLSLVLFPLLRNKYITNLLKLNRAASDKGISIVKLLWMSICQINSALLYFLKIVVFNMHEKWTSFSKHWTNTVFCGFDHSGFPSVMEYEAVRDVYLGHSYNWAKSLSHSLFLTQYALEIRLTCYSLGTFL